MEGRWRISVKGRNGKDKWKDKMRQDSCRQAGEQKVEEPNGAAWRSEISTINHSETTRGISEVAGGCNK